VIDKDRQRIVVDAMGGDNWPEVPILGALRAFKLWSSSLHICLVGQKKVIQEELDRILVSKKNRLDSRYLYAPEQFEIIDAPEVVSMSEKPANVIRSKKQSSLHVGIKLLKEGKADAFVSAGNTGAVMAVALIILKRIEGVDRPAIATVFPTSKGPCVVLDVGANAECSPLNLVQFGIMGAVYAEQVLGIPIPQLGLMSMGEEDEKGDSATIAANSILRRLSGMGKIHFYGNVQGGDVISGRVQVISCNGYVGNAVLKLAEKLLPTLKGSLKNKIKQGPFSQKVFAYIASKLLTPTLAAIKRDFDPDEYGGAPLLGVPYPIIIAHGGSSPWAIANAIDKARLAAQHNVSEKIKNRFQKLKTSEL